MKGRLMVPAIASISILGCAVSTDYHRFEQAKVNSYEKVIRTEKGELILDSSKANSRVAISPLKSDTLQGYGTPFAVVIVNRGKSPVLVQDDDFSVDQEGTHPTLVTVAKTQEVDSFYKNATLTANIVGAMALGVVLSLAHAESAADAMVAPLEKNLTNSENIVKARSADYVGSHISIVYLMPGKATVGIIVLDNLSSKPIVIHARVGDDLHDFDFSGK